MSKIGFKSSERMSFSAMNYSLFHFQPQTVCMFGDNRKNNLTKADFFQQFLDDNVLNCTTKKWNCIAQRTFKWKITSPDLNFIKRNTDSFSWRMVQNSSRNHFGVVWTYSILQSINYWCKRGSLQCLGPTPYYNKFI